MREFFTYAEFDDFWQKFRPLTPFGREVHARRPVQTRADELEALWDQTQVALDLLDGCDEFQASRLSHHLKRLPRIPREERALYDEVELFQVKKFLHNYRALVQRLPESVQRFFGLEWPCQDLLERLGVGRQSPETFYVSDEYSDELAGIRAEIRRADETLARVRARRAAEIEEAWNLGFGTREFLVVPRERLRSPGDSPEAGLARMERWLLVEAYDQAHVLVRPRASAEELRLEEERSGLQARERAAEDRVLEDLSSRVRAELPHLEACRRAVQAFDLALARARLSREQALTRPRLTLEGPIHIQGGRFVPCEETCRRLGTTYRPLEATFDTSATVVFGSNMGGKTVVLKTLAFLQACAQTGLFVPAGRFVTRVFHSFHYVGEGAERGSSQGLSGFGFEVRQFNRVWRDLDQPTLALFDEFARTTHSQEAEALISAILEALAGNPRAVALFSTHFRGVRRLPGVRYLRMKGLDRKGLDFGQAKAEGPDSGQATGTDLDQRIRLIDNHMEYLLVPDEGIPRNSDALAVATLLGMDPALAGRAERFFLEGNETTS